METRLHRVGVVVLIAVLPLSLQAKKAKAGGGNVTSEIRQLAQDFDVAWNARQLDQVVAFYADDAVLLPQGMPAARGRDAIRNVLKGFMDAGATDLKLESERTESAGDLAFDAGSYSWREGSGKEHRGKYITTCLLYTSPSPRDLSTSRMPSSA